MKDCLPLLAQGIEHWNQWRYKYPLRPCSLAGHDLSQGYFFEGNFRKVSLKGAKLRRACLVGADLSEADLSGADLRGAYLSDADLTGANLSDANLTGAILDRADMRGANLLGAQVAEVDLQTAKLATLAEEIVGDTAEEAVGNAAGDNKKKDAASPVGGLAVDSPALSPSMAAPSAPTLSAPVLSALMLSVPAPSVPAPSVPATLLPLAQADSMATLPVVSHSVVKPRRLRQQVALNLRSLVQDSPEVTAFRQESIRQSPMPGQAGKGIAGDDGKRQWGQRQTDSRVLSTLSTKRRWMPAIAAAGLALTIGLPLAANSIGGDDTLPALVDRSTDSLVLAKSLTSTSRILSIATRTLPSGSTQVFGGTADGNIQIWDGQTGKTMLTLMGHTGGVKALALSPSGDWLVSSSDDGLKVWNPSLGQLIHTIPAVQDAIETGAISSVAIASDESTFIASDQSGTITAWDMRSGQERYQIKGDRPVWSVAIAPDSTTFVSSGQDRTIRQWDLATGTPVRSFTGHDDAVRTVTISPDGQTLASGSRDQTIKLWSLATGEPKATLKGHRDQVFSLAISSDSQTLASSSSDGTLKLWDLASSQLTKTLDEETHSLVTVAFAADNGPLVSGGSSQQVNIWQ
ncbi:MAG: pentapeptide repeat-containing protein [Phormidesmis sp.]